jgi:hypothetical protein
MTTDSRSAAFAAIATVVAEILEIHGPMTTLAAIVQVLGLLRAALTETVAELPPQGHA